MQSQTEQRFCDEIAALAAELAEPKTPQQA
jgi:hypothetical protein